MRSRSALVVHLDRLSRNIDKLKNLCPENEIIFMVKADAYGHGILEVSRFACEDLGIKELGCASIEEGVFLRQNIKKASPIIYIFSDFVIKEDASLIKAHNLIPVISSKEQLKDFLRHESLEGTPLCLKFNTGMNRLGLEVSDINWVIGLLKTEKRKSIFHLMSHLSSSSLSMKKNKRNISQIENFSRLKENFREQEIFIEHSSIANSGAIEQKAGLNESHIRPGLMLYGPSSVVKRGDAQSYWTGEVISDFKTSVLTTFNVEKGTPVGYGANPVPRSGTIAIIPIGYGDGFSTQFQGSYLTHNGEKPQVVGRVNMDMAQVLFENAESVKVGEDFFIWNSKKEYFEELAKQTKLIPYELFCQVSKRIPRIYLN